MKQTKEFLSILQFLIYKAQKRQKSKEIVKYQKIFYKSNSLLLHILNNKYLINLEKIKFKSSLSQIIFERILKILILKKEIQVHSFLNSKLKSNKTLINIIENFDSFSGCSCFFIDFIKQKIFSIDFIFYSYFIKLSYLAFLNYFLLFSRINKNKFLTRDIDSFFFMLLQKNKILFYDVDLFNKKNKYFFISPGSESFLFHYKNVNSFFNHNFFLYSEKVHYQNRFFFDFLSNKKYLNFLNQNKKNKYQLYNRKKLVRKNFLNIKNKLLKNTFYYYSSIKEFPSLIQNNFNFYLKFLKSCFLKRINKKVFKNLTNIQKQVLILLSEPIWEAYFEICLYGSRRGRSLFDAVEFLRVNLKKKPMFLFKTYTVSFQKLQNSRKSVFNKNKIALFYSKKKIVQKEKLFFLFFCFLENVIFHGVQKKHQNYYLITKQQIVLYQILKNFRQNTKNNILFYKIFYYSDFVSFFIKKKISNKLEKKILDRKNSFVNFKVQKNKFSIIDYRKFILKLHKNKCFRINKKKILIFSKNYIVKSFLILSLSDYFIDTIKSFKEKLFYLELKKQNFLFYLQKIFVTFKSMNSLSIQQRRDFSIILKDSTLFVSKNNYVFFLRKKKNCKTNNVCHKHWYFSLKTKNKNRIFLKKLKYSIKTIEKIHNFKDLFGFYKKTDVAKLKYKKLLQINLFVLQGYHNNFVKFAFFYNISVIFSLFIKNNDKKPENIFILLTLNLHIKIFSFFKKSLIKLHLIYLLKKNDINIILNNFLKYQNLILYYNYNYTFLKSFTICLKKLLFFNILFFYFYLKKKIFIYKIKNFFLKSFVFSSKGFLDIYFKNLYFLPVLEVFSDKKLLFSKIKKELINTKYINLFNLWSIKFFVIQKKHTFLFYNKSLNGFYFFQFFIYHKNKNNQKLFSNSLFFWQFYYIHFLIKYKYIQSFLKYYQILNFINKKLIILKFKQLSKIFKFYFFQYFSYKNQNLYFWRFSNFVQIFLNFSLFYKTNHTFLLLFKAMLYKINKNQSSLIFYNKLIKYKQIKINYYFSIQPSKFSIRKHLSQIYRIVKQNSNKNQQDLIFKLSKLIKNWCLSYQILTPTIVYKYIDYLILQILWKWACRRHSKKSKKWIKLKYFYKFNFIYTTFKDNENQKFLKERFKIKKKLVFACEIKYSPNIQKTKAIVSKQFSISNTSKILKKTFLCLPNHTDSFVVKHKVVQQDRSPFDLDFIYWIKRY